MLSQWWTDPTCEMSHTLSKHWKCRKEKGTVQNRLCCSIRFKFSQWENLFPPRGCLTCQGSPNGRMDLDWISAQKYGFRAEVYRNCFPCLLGCPGQSRSILLLPAVLVPFDFPVGGIQTTWKETSHQQLKQNQKKH